MEIYLIRHGETEGNVAHRHQVEKTQLTTLGRQQAEKVAAVMKEYKPTHLVTSNLVRAIETARIIGQECDLMPETTEYFIELARPKFLYGNYHFSLQSLWFYFQWYIGFGVGAKEGETYEMLLQRIKLAKQYLQQFPDNAKVVVVSHSVFITLFTAHVCHEKKMSFWQGAKAFWKVYKMANTQVTPILFDATANIEGKCCAWSVDRWLES
ncbi:MAG: hypothetical protein RLZZ230_800 [Candidatus Parcubacteria bacterium]|jgi:broad specificity phosphatase PhoE